MGVDYVQCECCEETVTDCGMTSLKISGIGQYDLCVDCCERLKGSELLILKRRQPDWTYVLLTDPPRLYSDWERFKQDVKREEEYEKLGFIRQPLSTLDQRFKDALLERNDCGGAMTEQDVREWCKKMRENNPDSRWFHSTVYVFWRQYSRKSDTSSYLKLYGTERLDPEYMLGRIKTFEESHRIRRGTLFIITERYSDISYFCFPEKDSRITLCNNLKELREKKWDPKSADSSASWFPTEQFMADCVSDEEDRKRKREEEKARKHKIRKLIAKEV